MALLVAAQPASAATDIEGSPDEVVLRVQNAPIADVLAALAARFKLTYRAPPNLTRQLSGRYSGSLSQVLVRILDDVDYVVDNSNDGIKLVILNPAERAKGSPSGTPDNRSGNGVSGVPSAGAGSLPAQANSPQTVAVQANSIQASQSASGPTARQPLVMPDNATSATVPPLASFLPTNSPMP